MAACRCNFRGSNEEVNKTKTLEYPWTFVPESWQMDFHEPWWLFNGVHCKRSEFERGVNY